MLEYNGGLFPKTKASLINSANSRAFIKSNFRGNWENPWFVENLTISLPATPFLVVTRITPLEALEP